MRRNDGFEYEARDLWLGLIVVICVIGVALVAGYQFILKPVLRTSVPFHAEMAEAYGIRAGSEVALAGMSVGKVTDVTLTDNFKIDLALAIEPAYAARLPVDTYIEIGTSLTVGGVLKGARLSLRPGTSTEMLTPNAAIRVQPPVSVGSVVNLLDPTELAQRVHTISKAIEQIAGTLGDVAPELAATIEHTQILTANLSEATGSLPELMGEMQTALNHINSAATVIGARLEKVAGMEGSISGLLHSATRTLDRAEPVLAAAEPVLMASTPALMRLEQSLATLDQLLRQLQGHWLLGGRQPPAENQLPLGFLPNDELYREQSAETAAP